MCDLLAIAFGPELIDAYLDEKIILTNRDVNSWHKSCERTLFQVRTYWFHGVLQYFDWPDAPIASEGLAVPVCGQFRSER